MDRITSYKNIDFKRIFIDFELREGVANGFACSLTKTSIVNRFSLISSLGSGKWIRITSYKQKKTIFDGFSSISSPGSGDRIRIATYKNIDF